MFDVTAYTDKVISYSYKRIFMTFQYFPFDLQVAGMVKKICPGTLFKY